MNRLLAFVVGLALIVGSVSATWWNTNYLTKEGFNYSAQGMFGSLSNFAVPFYATPNFSGNAWTNGTETTQLPSEYEYINATNGLWWVRVPKLAVANDTAYHYFNPTSTTTNGTLPKQVFGDFAYLGAWHFGQDLSYDSSAQDATINVMTGVQRTGGKFGDGVNITGGSAQMSADYLDGFGGIINSITFAMWVKTNASGFCQLIDWRNSGDGDQGGYLALFPAPNFHLFSDSDQSLSSNPATALTPNVWHHIVGTYDQSASTMYLYIDGVLNNTLGGLGSDITPSTGTILTFLMNYQYGGSCYTASIDDVKFINQAVSADWVKANYDASAYISASENQPAATTYLTSIASSPANDTNYLVNSVVNLSVFWNSTSAVAFGTLETNAENGTNANTTKAASGNWTNFTITLNDTQNLYSWRIFANNTEGVNNVTTTQWLNVTNPLPFLNYLAYSPANGANYTVNSVVNLSVFWNSSSNVAYGVLQTNAENGTYQNTTKTASANWTNFTITLNETSGAYFWRVFANNTQGANDATADLELNATTQPPFLNYLAYSPANGTNFNANNSVVNLSVFWNSSSNVAYGVLETNAENESAENTTQAANANWTNFTITLNATKGVYYWRVYANNTQGTQSATPQIFLTVQDLDAPTYTLASIGVSETRAGYPATFHALWHNSNLSNWTIEIDTGNGILANQTTRFHAPGTTDNWTNYTATLNTTAGAAIRWRIWEYDATGNLAAIPLQTFTTQSTEVRPDFTSPANGVTYYPNDVVSIQVHWTTGLPLASGILETNFETGVLSNRSVVPTGGWTNFSFTTIAPRGDYQWRVYATDTLGSSNATGSFALYSPTIRYIHTNIKLEETIMTGLIGAAQFVVGFTDELNNPTNGAMNLGATFIAFSLFAAGLGAALAMFYGAGGKAKK